ncbi:MAG: cyclic nucleotide-binding domain-containing protein [Bdellovibrionales bacterium]|nr:cyclic nucleotide-binding domain-containing protein [Bdellovibrionales bacterium]
MNTLPRNQKIVKVSPKEVANPSFGSRLREFVPGECIVRENELAQSFFIITSGTAQMFKEAFSKRVVIKKLSEGEIFGEVCFLDGLPRAASVEALTHVKAVEVFPKVEGINIPDWLNPLVKTITRRMREANESLMEYSRALAVRNAGKNVDEQRKRTCMELSRLLDILRLIGTTNNNDMDMGDARKDFLVLAGDSFLSPYDFWRYIQKQAIVDQTAIKEKARMVINVPEITRLSKLFRSADFQTVMIQITTKGAAALHVLSTLIPKESQSGDSLSIDLSQYVKSSSAYYSPSFGDGLRELEALGILKYAADTKVVQCDRSQIETASLCGQILLEFESRSVGQ